MSHHSQIDVLLEWSKAKLAEGQESSWDWYQLMKLREALEAFMTSTDVAIVEGLPQPPDLADSTPLSAPPDREQAVQAVLEDDLVVTVSTKVQGVP